MDDDDVLRELKRLARRQKRELDETLDRIELLQEQQHVAHLPPEIRRSLIREWTKRLGGAVSIPVVAGLLWLKRHPAQVGLAAATAAAFFAVITMPQDEPRLFPPPKPTPVSPMEPMPAAPVTLTVKAEPTPIADSTDVPAGPSPDGEPPDESAPVGPPAPEPPAPAETPADVQPGPESRPPPDGEDQPEPEPLPEESPAEESPSKECAEVLPPRVELGECVRKILGLLD